MLKRRWEPRLAKKGFLPRKLKARELVYDFVEDGNTIRKSDISVILTDYVEGIGYKGDLVTTRPNKAYTKLLLTGLAVYDTPENRQKYDTEARLKEERRSPFIDRTVNVFARRLVAVCMNKFEPWVIEPWHIRASMRKAGLYVLNDSQIQLPKTPITGPDLAKQSKEFYVTVTINKTDKARVRCRLHHVCLDPKKREPWTSEWWEQPAGLLFPGEEGQEPFEFLQKSNQECQPN